MRGSFKHLAMPVIMATLALAGTGCVSTTGTATPTVSNHVVEDHTVPVNNIAKLADYVTPNSPGVVGFMAGVEDKSPEGIYQAVQDAGVGYALNSHDAKEMNGEEKDNKNHHGIQYPDETLKAGVGDCEDLVLLYCSLLENAGHSTTLLVTDSHVLMMYDTGVPSDDYKKTQGRHEYVSFKNGGSGNAWVPINASQIGINTFEKSNKSAMPFCHPKSKSDIRKGNPFGYYGKLTAIRN